MSSTAPRKARMRETITHCAPYATARPRRNGNVGWNAKGLVYFLYCEEANAVKIGFTASDIRARLGKLQSGCPYPLRFLHIEPGSFAREGELQRQFEHLWMRGEWYRYAEELADYLDGVMPK